MKKVYEYVLLVVVGLVIVTSIVAMKSTDFIHHGRFQQFDAYNTK